MLGLQCCAGCPPLITLAYQLCVNLTPGLFQTNRKPSLSFLATMGWKTIYSMVWIFINYTSTEVNNVHQIVFHPVVSVYLYQSCQVINLIRTGLKLASRSLSVSLAINLIRTTTCCSIVLMYCSLYVQLHVTSIATIGQLLSDRSCPAVRPQGWPAPRTSSQGWFRPRLNLQGISSTTYLKQDLWISFH